MSIKLNIETPVIKVEAKTGLDLIQYGTLVIGDTTTLPAGSSATVVNVGTEAKAVLNFGVPKGDKGDTGDVASDAKNVFTALNTFRANIAVSSGTTAGSQGQIILGNKPQSATVQANIISSTTGALNYIATERTGHYFKIGNNTAYTSITTNESETAILSHNAFDFARITNVGVAKWLGNANTATKLETARTINGVEFDGTKNITIKAGGIVDSLLAQNGYVKFANGLILQWGIFSSEEVTFPIAFGTPFVCLATDGLAAEIEAFALTELTRTGAKFVPVSRTIHIIAFGKA